MTRDELEALVYDLFGLSATPAKVETIMLAADAYAAAQIAAARARDWDTNFGMRFSLAGPWGPVSGGQT